MRQEVFNFEGQDIQAVEMDGDPWFLARQVTRILGIGHQTGHLLKGLDDDEKLTTTIVTAGQRRKVWLINESGLYALILRSNRPNARSFRKWITSHVIPAIRKNGAYAVPNVLGYLTEHTKRDVQVENSKTANSHNFRQGGLQQVLEYNRENCRRHTGYRPSEIQELARVAGMKSAQRSSGKEAVRHLLPAAACSMSLADNLVGRGHDLEQVAPITEGAVPVFEGLLAIGEFPAELGQS